MPSAAITMSESVITTAFCSAVATDSCSVDADQLSSIVDSSGASAMTSSWRKLASSIADASPTSRNSKYEAVTAEVRLHAEKSPLRWSLSDRRQVDASFGSAQYSRRCDSVTSAVSPTCAARSATRSSKPTSPM